MKKFNLLSAERKLVFVIIALNFLGTLCIKQWDCCIFLGFLLVLIIKKDMPDIIAAWRSRLKKKGNCIRLPIIRIDANPHRKQKNTYAHYVIVEDRHTEEHNTYSYSNPETYVRTYKSPEVFYDLYSYFTEGDELLVYIDPKNPDHYFVDLYSCEAPQKKQVTLEDILPQIAESIVTGKNKMEMSIPYSRSDNASQSNDSSYNDITPDSNTMYYDDIKENKDATSTASYATSNAPSHPKDSPYGDIDDNMG